MAERRPPYAVGFAFDARAELTALRAVDGRRIATAVSTNLQHEPFAATRNRKQLDGVEPGFEFDPPLWELRVGDFRVFYDGSIDERTVTIRAVRRKGPSQTTQEVVS